MSGNRRKPTTRKPATTAEDPPAARVVAIPKEPAAAAPSAPAKPKVEASKSDRIGDILRTARNGRGDDLYQIAEYLCIKPAFLIALENSRYDELPADAYVIGFLRTYANFLGIDGKHAVDRYRYEMAGRRKKPVLAMPTPVSEGRAPTGIIMVGATVAVLLVYALWYGISSSNRAEVNAPPPLPTATQPVPAVTSDGGAAGLTAPVGATANVPLGSATVVSTTGAIPPAAPGIVVTAEKSPAAVREEAKAALAALKDVPASDIAPPKDVSAKEALTKELIKVPKELTKDAPKDASKDTSKDAVKDDGKSTYGDAKGGASRVVIRATQSSWVMITDDSGKAVFDRVLKPGESYKVPGKPGLSLTTGNGAGIVLSLDGNDLPKIANGAPHVVRNIDLDPDHLTAEPPTEH